ncbi:hypothetical protein [Methylocella silvestris]|uniref:Uncharacterized protein n=1 Tax=Methylocella silvestris TaxID=199596 RepID=A0A2J7TMG8_METSI|nr:hypothetical protein [Methylocella silvestris]PNG27897.1 hypothetical protein CR492_03135 [Methylocella silvestris]
MNRREKDDYAAGAADARALLGRSARATDDEADGAAWAQKLLGKADDDFINAETDADPVDDDIDEPVRLTPRLRANPQPARRDPNRTKAPKPTVVRVLPDGGKRMSNGRVRYEGKALTDMLKRAHPEYAPNILFRSIDPGARVR